jgi:hypothetical protein
MTIKIEKEGKELRSTEHNANCVTPIFQINAFCKIIRVCSKIFYVVIYNKKIKIILWTDWRMPR